ncbi:MAG: prolipoprotein diacylglyceryl transferase [Bacteriovoracaceae bacterium]
MQNSLINLDPVLLRIAGFQLTWYWLVYFLGAILSPFLISKINAKEGLGLDRSTIIKGSLLIAFGYIIGGRLGYALFYNPEYYFENPYELFQIYKGGMSFHGAIIGSTVLTLLSFRKETLKAWRFLDIVVTIVPWFLILGRVSNFLNGELIGRKTEAPWGVIFSHVDQFSRHPSQIYEAIGEGLVLGLILWFSRDFKKVTQQCSHFLMGYGVIRIILEFFREPDPHIGFVMEVFTLGQVYCLYMVIAGLWLRKKFIETTEN